MPYLDLHAHFAMQLKIPALPTGDAGKDKLYSRLMRLANRVANFEPFGRPRITLNHAAAAGLKGFASVLYDPSDEFCGMTQPFESIRTQMRLVNEKVGADDRFQMARSGPELAGIIEHGGRIAVFHAIEGGYAVEDPRNVEELAAAGVAYVTLAHLFYREVATCVNPFPCLNDDSYARLFPQPARGLTDLGAAICEELFRKRLLVDITHCRQDAIDDVFRIASRYPNHPVIASHTAARRVNHALLNASNDTIGRIAASGGIAGVIFYDHWLKPTDPAECRGSELDWLFCTVDAIVAASSFDHVGIGSDLDGFIKPIKGLENTTKCALLKAELGRRYGEANAVKMLYGNALRVLKTGWKP